MVTAIAAGNRHKALKYYYDLIALKESPMKILSLIAREFNLLLLVKAIRNEGGGKDEIIKACGINPYFVGRYISVSGRFTHEYLKEAVTDCIETETLFKQGRMNDVMGVEMLIIKYSAHYS
jgi:DNA polymerase-3 subunit delta